MEQIPLHAIFSGDPSSMRLSPSNPPVVDHGKAVSLTKGGYGFDSFVYRIKYSLEIN